MAVPESAPALSSVLSPPVLSSPDVVVILHLPDRDYETTADVEFIYRQLTSALHKRSFTVFIKPLVDDPRTVQEIVFMSKEYNEDDAFWRASAVYSKQFDDKAMSRLAARSSFPKDSLSCPDAPHWITTRIREIIDMGFVAVLDYDSQHRFQRHNAYNLAVTLKKLQNISEQQRRKKKRQQLRQQPQQRASKRTQLVVKNTLADSDDKQPIARKRPAGDGSDLPPAKRLKTV